MAERLYYSKAGPIDPIALVLENVAVWTRGNWHCYRVRYIDPIKRCNPLVFDVGAIVAGGTIGDTALVNLNQQGTPPAIAQLRFYTPDDIRVTLKIGQAESRFTTTMLTTTCDLFTDLRDPCGHLTEFIVLQANTPFIDCQNPTDYAINVARVAFYGFRYLLDDLQITKPGPEEVKDAIAAAVTTPKANRVADRSYPVTSNIVYIASGSD